MGFPLDAHTITRGARLSGQRIAPGQRRRGRRLEPQDDKLPGESRGDRLTVRGLERQRGYVAALSYLARYAKRTKSTPLRRRARRCSETGISGCCVTLLLLCEQRLEGTMPTGAQRRDAKCALQQMAGMTGHVEQRVDLEHAHVLGPGRDLRDLVASLDLPFVQHPEIEAGSTVLDHQCGHFWFVQSDA